MGIFDTAKQQYEEQVAQENALHEQYAADLLEKHGLTNRTPLGLELDGYYLEHHVEPGDNGQEIHSWRLFKLYDSSPKYGIKRVIAVEALPNNNGSDLAKGTDAINSNQSKGGRKNE